MDKKERLTLGYLAPRFFNGFNVGLFTGILNAAKENNINFLCYSGPSNMSPEYIKQHNIVFDLVDPDKVAGLVCWTSGLYQQDGYLFDIENFLKKYKHIPFVCIEKQIKGHPTVLIDNYHGIFELVSHLVNVHGFKKIAFVKGPEFHSSAQNRYEAFLDSMKKFDIPVDPRLVTSHNSFDTIAGISAVQYFFKELNLKPKTDIEAVITINDFIAVGAIKELQKMGIRVPDDVAVVGFNNKEEGLEIMPQLTTVDSQANEIGRNAVNAALSLIRGENLPDFMHVPTKLIVRESCGCHNPAILGKTNPLIYSQDMHEKDYGKISEVILDNKGNILDSLNEIFARHKNSDYRPEWGHILFGSFLTDLLSDSGNEFNFALMEILGEEFNRRNNFPMWQEVITKIRVNILPLINNMDLISRAETILHNARVILLQKREQTLAINDFAFFRKEDIFPTISNSIVTTFEVEKLMDIIEKELPRLGIEACYISLYENTEEPAGKARLVMAYDENGHIDMGKFETEYPASKLLPQGILTDEKRFEILVEPLFFQDNPLGFIMFRIDLQTCNTYLTLCSQISSALQGSMLVKRVEERAAELEESNKTLKDNQQRLIISEKMASLGRLTAGIAHEMNTPLATVLAALKELNSLVDEYKRSIGRPQVLPEDHHAISLDMDRHLKVAIQSAEKSIGFIRGIKTQTYDLGLKNLRLFNAANVILENLNILEYTIKNSNCKFESELDKELTLTGDPRFLSQILTNLIINSADACKPDGGIITVNLKKMDTNKGALIVKDTGSGISSENLIKIFDPFFTTKPFGEGTGLGLSIVHDLVKEFNGNIEVQSRPGETVFTIIFPLK